MFFRHATLFRFSPAVAGDLQRLEEVLGEHRLRPCGPTEMFTKGFVPPVGNDDDSPLLNTVKHCTWLTVGGEDKILPTAVVNDELQRKVRKIAEENGRKVGGRERKRLKEDVITELKQCAKKLGRVPTYPELRKTSRVTVNGIRKHVGTLSRALRAAELEVGHAGITGSMKDLFND